MFADIADKKFQIFSSVFHLVFLYSYQIVYFQNALLILIFFHRRKNLQLCFLIKRKQSSVKKNQTNNKNINETYSQIVPSVLMCKPAKKKFIFLVFVPFLLLVLSALLLRIIRFYFYFIFYFFYSNMLSQQHCTRNHNRGTKLQAYT